VPPHEDGVPPDHLVRFLATVSRCTDTASAVQVAAELAAQALGAEAGAATVGRSTSSVVAFGGLTTPVAHLVADAPGDGPVEVDGVGVCHRLGASWNAGTAGRLWVARTGAPFTQADGEHLVALASGLGLALDMIGAVERQANQERLLTVLLDIQRSISQRVPLTKVLTAITEGAGTVLHGWPVSLVLDDDLDGRRLVVGADLPDSPTTVAVPVHVHGVRTGVLRTQAPDGAAAGPLERELLQTFAEHASLALSEARTFEAMQEAFWDGLTGLPTRQLLVDRLRHLLREADGHEGPSLLLLHLDRFGAVNDILGRAAGDELLQQVTERLLDVVSPEDTVARFGGAEFAVLLPGPAPSAPEQVARRVIASLGRPFTVHGTLVHVGVAVGVAHSGEVGGSAEELLSNADVARYRARAAGSGAVVTYDGQMRSELLERLELQAHLQTALDRHELVLHYQPIVELESGRSIGVEALLRWTHPDRGAVPPSDFIPIAEVTGAIVPIGRWVLRTACRQIARWRRVDPDLTMNVNVSPHQLRDPRFPQDVREALEETGVPGSALILEITESALLEDDDHTLASLRTLKEMGVAVALDDFGTGYSALGYLRRFPVDILKIDRSFVSGGDARRDDGDQLVRTIVELGRAYELDVVAEGIEDEEQRRRLVALGCSHGQGYHFGKPADGDSIDARLATVHPLVPRPRAARPQRPGAHAPWPSA
jgi:diguanylate cyclase (GGDEF)-like protein